MKKLIYLFLLIYLAIMSIYLYKNQFYNSDIEAYMGLIYKNNDSKMDISSIHKKVYEELKTKNPKLLKAGKSMEGETIGANTYYKDIYENPKIFEEELQLFTVKPFYNLINLIFYKVGFSPASATFMSSILSYVLILFFIFIFIKKETGNDYLAIILTLIISLFKPLLDASRHASPDVLACLLLLLGVYYFLLKKDVFIATIFGMLCIFTRPDYFVFYTLFLALIYFFKEKFHFKTPILILSFTFLFLSFAVIQFFNQVSWSTLLMNQFIKVQLYPVSNPDVFVFSDYLKLIKKSLFFEFNTSYFPILLVLIISIIASRFDKNNKHLQFYVLFMAVIYLTVFIRFFIFPSLATRMMVGYYLLIILMLIFLLNSKKDLLKNSTVKR